MSDAFRSSDEFDEQAHQLYNEGSYEEALALLRLLEPERYKPGSSLSIRFSELYEAQGLIGRRLNRLAREMDACSQGNAAVDELLAGSQQDFPVIENEMPVGILRRNDLVKALAENRQDSLVSDFMCRRCESVDIAESLTPIVELMRQKDCGTVPVTQGGRIVGLLTLENIGEMIMINTALEQNSRGLGQRRVA